MIEVGDSLAGAIVRSGAYLWLGLYPSNGEYVPLPHSFVVVYVLMAVLSLDRGVQILTGIASEDLIGATRCMLSVCRLSQRNSRCVAGLQHLGVVHVHSLVGRATAIVSELSRSFQKGSASNRTTHVCKAAKYSSSASSKETIVPVSSKCSSLNGVMQEPLYSPEPEPCEESEYLPPPRTALKDIGGPMLTSGSVAVNWRYRLEYKLQGQRISWRYLKLIRVLARKAARVKLQLGPYDEIGIDIQQSRHVGVWYDNIDELVSLANSGCKKVGKWLLTHAICGRIRVDGKSTSACWVNRKPSRPGAGNLINTPVKFEVFKKCFGNPLRSESGSWYLPVFARMTVCKVKFRRGRGHCVWIKRKRIADLTVRNVRHYDGRYDNALVGEALRRVHCCESKQE